MKNIWITADSHYSHKNICRGVTEWKTLEGDIPVNETWDFPTIEKMNDTMVNNINNVVMQDDILIHLGDWSFGGFEKIQEFYNRLVCKNIYLILGNHDHHIKKNRDYIREIFLLGVDKADEEYRVAGLKDQTFHLSHYPIVSWKDIRKGSIHLHGHSHLTGDDRFGKGKRMDVGIIGHPEFRPYNLLTEVMPLMDARPIASEYTNITDHHIDRIKHKS
jgi:calcineurin-like phosphoesterase family protein